MFAYFRAWKRQIGVAALLMACAFINGWVRSNGVWDSLYFNYGIGFGFDSCDGRTIWSTNQSPEASNGSYYLKPESFSKPGPRAMEVFRIWGSRLPARAANTLTIDFSFYPLLVGRPPHDSLLGMVPPVETQTNTSPATLTLTRS